MKSKTCRVPDPQSVEELICILQTESERRKRNRRNLAYSFGIGFSTLTILFVAIWIAKGRPPDGFFTQFSSLVWIIGAGAAVSSTHKKMLQLATENADPRLTGFFIEAVAFQDAQVAEMARGSLAARLPKLDRLGYASFSEEQNLQLARSIQSQKDTKFTREVLNTLQRFGGKEAIIPLESFIRLSPPKKESEEWQKIRLAANLVVADVRIRLAKEIISRKLEENVLIHQKALSELPGIVVQPHP